MRHPYRALFVSVIMVGMLLCGSQREAAASDDEVARATLRGLPGVNVLVEALTAEAERNGLTRAQIQTDVELRLRKAGIRVLSETERDETPGRPFLYVTVNARKARSTPLYAFSIHVALAQRVLLERDPQISSLAETWSISSTGIVGESHLRELTRSEIADRVDAFLNAYLAVNPSGDV